jgi:predicted DNA-binding transcriptional regulator YafY
MKSAQLNTPGPKANRVSRIVQIMTTLQTGKGYAAAELSRLFGISRRTLFRDLKEIRNIAEGGFLPPINLNLQEALGLLLLVHKMRRTIQLPFKHSALLAAMKIESALPPRVRRYCEHALAKISARTSPQAPALGLPGLDSIFSMLQSAIAQQRKVHICYDSLFDGGTINCELSPYHLFYNQRAWYVVGHSSVHKTVRTFKLNRIKDAQILDDTFSDGDSFDLTEYIGRAWSMIPEGRIYNVRLCFAPKVANNVAEVQWHGTQKVLRNADGSATLEFRVDGLGEITWWILGYGDQVEVLSPATLRNKVAEIARRMAKINDGPIT